MSGYHMGQKQIDGRLRTCCRYCGSLSIYKVKSLRIYRCFGCNQSFVTPSSRIVESYKRKLVTLSAGAEKTKKLQNCSESV